jgi:hypothetical protein
MQGSDIYSIDTSALLDAWVRWYPPDLFPKLWENIETLISEQRIFATEEVLVELEKKDDDIFKWAKKQKMFYPLTTEIQTFVSQILTKYPRLVDSRRERSQADPFVIALAKHKNCVVITGEKNFGTEDRPRIPIVCKEFEIKSISIVQLIRSEGWRFS